MLTLLIPERVPILLLHTLIILLILSLLILSLLIFRLLCTYAYPTPPCTYAHFVAAYSHYFTHALFTHTICTHTLLTQYSDYCAHTLTLLIPVRMPISLPHALITLLILALLHSLYSHARENRASESLCLSLSLSLFLVAAYSRYFTHTRITSLALPSRARE